MRFVDAHSFHPTLSLTLTPSIPPSLSSSCDANLLLHLPSGVFYDPYTANNDVIGAREGRSQRGTVLTSAEVKGVELEQAVGWVGRAKGGRGVGRQWWERASEAREEEEGLDLQDILSAALRKKAEEVVGAGEAVKVSLDRGNRVQIKPPAQQQRGEDERERTTVVLPIQIDDLLNANGAFRLDVPLHVRYHPPTAATIDTPSSFTTLLHDILPSSALNLYHTFHHCLGLPSSSSAKPNHKSHTQLTLSPPTIYVSCPTSPSPSSLVSKLFPKSHAHLKSQLNASNFVAHTTSTSTTTLKLNIPVPQDSLLPPVQLTTILTVVGAALAVVYHLLVNVLPVLEEVEKSW